MQACARHSVMRLVRQPGSRKWFSPSPFSTIGIRDLVDSLVCLSCSVIWQHMAPDYENVFKAPRSFIRFHYSQRDCNGCGSREEERTLLQSGVAAWNVGCADGYTLAVAVYYNIIKRGSKPAFGSMSS